MYLGSVGTRSIDGSVCRTTGLAKKSFSRFRRPAGWTCLNPTSEADLSVVVDRPVGDGPFPVLIVVPGGTKSGDPGFAHISKTGLDRSRLCCGDLGSRWTCGTSEGQEDRGGHIRLRWVESRDRGRFPSSAVRWRANGIGESISWCRHGIGFACSLPDEIPVHFLIDWEGPADRYDLMECAPDMGLMSERARPL